MNYFRFTKDNYFESNLSIKMESLNRGKIYQFLVAGIKDMGFTKYKELPEKDNSILFAIYDEGETCEGVWGTFPIIASAKENCLEFKLLFSVREVARSFSGEQFEKASHYMNACNRELKLGFFSWNEKNQVEYLVRHYLGGLNSVEVQNLPKHIVGDSVNSYKRFSYGFNKILEGSQLSVEELLDLSKQRMPFSEGEPFLLLNSSQKLRELARELRKPWKITYNTEKEFREELEFLDRISKSRCKDCWEAESVEVDQEANSITFQVFEHHKSNEIYLAENIHLVVTKLRSIQLELKKFNIWFTKVPSTFVLFDEIRISEKAPLQSYLKLDSENNFEEEFEELLTELILDSLDNAQTFEEIDTIKEGVRVNAKNNNFSELEGSYLGEQVRLVPYNHHQYRERLPLTHPSFVKTYGVFAYKRKYYTVLQGSRNQRLKEDPKNSNLSLIQEVARAVEYAHFKNKTLSCISDQNVFVIGGKAKLDLDCYEDYWKPPEPEPSKSGDMYSLGLFLHYLLTKRKGTHEGQLEEAKFHPHKHQLEQFYQREYPEFTEIIRECCFSNTFSRLNAEEFLEEINEALATNN